MLRLIGQGLLDPDGVHAHFREDCPRVRLLLGSDAAGLPGIWAVPWPAGGRPQLASRFDDPVRQPYRPWARSRDRVFVLLQESESDVWVVETAGMWPSG